MVSVRFEAFFDGIGEVMRSDEVTEPMRVEAESIASRANAASALSGEPLGATVIESERSGDRRPEAQVRADVAEDEAWRALSHLRKAADV